ncbi:HAD family phosphatase [Streptomyces sp. SID12488]|uniref:HAD family hydrolase n=1 Tax=Streptomyces sp. SID12488 TaxID=2706040 RepID=UPI0031BA91B5
MQVDPDPLGTREAWPRAVVFDHDGVLVDSIRPDFQACLRVFAEHGVELPAERWGREVCGNTGGYTALFQLLTDPADCTGDARVSDAGALVPSREGVSRPTVEELRARLEAYWDELLVPANVPLMPGVRELLTRLTARGVRLAVASSADRRWVTRMLAHHGLAGFFETVVGGDDVARAKPAPDVYREALSRLGVAPEHALAVEDSLTGVSAARAAGLRVVAVPTPYTRSLDYGAAHARITGLPLLTDDLLNRLLEEDEHVPYVR